MRNKSQTWSPLLFAALLTVFAATSQAAIIESDFHSTGSRQELNGTAIGLATNQPGGTWVVGAGWDWSWPFVSATWDPPGLAVNLVPLAEAKTVLGLSIASSGGYTKPARIHLAAGIEFTGDLVNTGGVGFFSVVPARANNLNQFEHFTGLYINETNGTLQVMADGSLAGSAVSVGTISEDVFYNIGYDINTLTGGLSNVMFGGNPVSGLSSTAFTDGATAYAAVVSGNGSRATLNHLVVSEVAVAEGDVPEPASLALLGLAASGLGGYIRRRRTA